MNGSELAKKAIRALIEPSPVNLLEVGLAALPENQTSKAQQEYQSGIEETILTTGNNLTVVTERVAELHQWVAQIHQQVSAKFEENGPTASDVADLLVRLGAEYPRAGNAGKRKILSQAFFSSFDPQWYENGMSRHLWSIAARIEYPEARLLAESLKSLPRNGTDRWMHVNDASIEFYLAQRLSRLDLLREHGPDFLVLDLAYEFIEFAWPDDEQNSD